MMDENIIVLISAGLVCLASLIATAASLIATAASIYIVRFHRFARERWWERKVDAYTHIILSLSDLVDYFSFAIMEHIERIPMSKTWKQEIIERMNKANREVTKAYNLGAFLISPEAESSIKKFKDRHMGRKGKSYPEDYDFYQEFEKDLAEAKKCLEEMVRYAKKDLSI